MAFLGMFIAILGALVVMQVRTHRALRLAQFELALRRQLDDAFDESAVRSVVAGTIMGVGGETAIGAHQRTALRACEGSRLATVRLIAATAHDASTDSLTGLLNRRSLDAQLLGVVEVEEMYSVAVADLDHFKSLKDRKSVV